MHRSRCVVPSPPGHSRRARASLTKQSLAALGAMSFIIFPAALCRRNFCHMCAAEGLSLEKQCFNLNVSQIYIKHGLGEVWRTYVCRHICVVCGLRRARISSNCIYMFIDLSDLHNLDTKLHWRILFDSSKGTI